MGRPREFCRQNRTQFATNAYISFFHSFFLSVERQFSTLLIDTTESVFVSVPAGSPSRGGDDTVYVLDITNRACPLFLFCSCVCLYGAFNCISFHEFSRQLSAFSLCSSVVTSALLVGPFNYKSLYERLYWLVLSIIHL